jgi:hypothetical protein
MTTVFQPGAFQSDAFQIEGGVAATDFQVTIAVVQDSDSLSITLGLPPSNVAAGRSSRKKRERYIAQWKGQTYEFPDIYSLEEFIAKAMEAEKPKPKKIRAPVKITLSPDFVEELIEEQIAPPRRISAMPQSVALAQVKKLEAMLLARFDDEEELMLIL